jgi:predicted metal-dependent hydrolase
MQPRRSENASRAVATTALAVYKARVQLDFFGRLRGRPPAPTEPAATLTLNSGRTLALHFVRHPRARRYVLRLDRNGAARVTVPRGGSLRAAREFAGRHTAWLERQIEKHGSTPEPPAWGNGTEFLFRGEAVVLTVTADGQRAVFAGEELSLGRGKVRQHVERHLRALALVELSARTRELAAQHGVCIRRITVRDQRTRWGSCSARGTISLNWRLIQTPPWVRDYIILHELMHTREMNHSARFWRQVEAVCPAWREAERWLRKNGRVLRD